MPGKKAMKDQIKQEASSIRKILNQWDPLGGSPEDEYDCLVDHIVSALHRGMASSSNLARLIKVELNDHFGIKQSEKSIFNIAESIHKYWVNQHK
jgi:hypothetical protein